MAFQPLRLAGGLFILLSLAGCDEQGPQSPSESGHGLTDPAIEPRIVSTYPANGAVGPFDLFAHGDRGYYKPHFVVELNKLVDPSEFSSAWIRVEGFDEPVRTALHLEYASAQAAARGNHTARPLTNVLAIRIVSEVDGYRSVPYSVGQTYSVVIDTTLEDLTQRHPRQPYRFSFLPEPDFRVVSTRPSDDTEGVSPESELIVWFNSPVDSAILSSVQVLPSRAGHWRTSPLSAYYVIFRHLETFSFGERYTIQVESDAADTLGHGLGAPFISSFRIVPFEIKQTSPPNGFIAASPATMLDIYTTGTIDTITARPAFSIDPAVSGQLLPFGNGMRFLPTNELVYDTQYTITISTDLRAQDGTYLAQPYSFFFRTDRFRVAFVSPLDDQPDVSLQAFVTIACSGSIDDRSIPLAFSISPAVQGTFGSLGSDSAFLFRPNDQLSPRTVYTVRVSTDLRSSSGIHLASPYTFSFRTGTL